MKALCCALGALIAATAPALADPLALSLPQGAQQTDSRDTAATDYRMLTGAWNSEGGKSVLLAGTRRDTAWQLPGDATATLDLLNPLRDQISAAGYDILYSCATDACGGFDFRYALDLLPEPEMHVDLGDFRYLVARHGGEWLALTVSRSSQTGFVHLTTLSVGGPEIGNPDAPPRPAPKPGAGDTPPAANPDLAQTLETEGHVALDDLAFESGDATLLAGDAASLQALAEYLSTHPEARIVLVGHTDATGALEANVALSEQRAQTVMGLLVSRYRVPAPRLSARGAGWLAPRASNATEAGRESNRRVEAVLLPD